MLTEALNMLEKGNHIPSIPECFSMIEVRKKKKGTEGTNLDMQALNC